MKGNVGMKMGKNREDKENKEEKWKKYGMKRSKKRLYGEKGRIREN